MASAGKRLRVLTGHMGASAPSCAVRPARTAQRMGPAATTVPMRIKAEVQQALAQGKPVVALESTIISHGMPYPQNLETALEVEGVVRQHGAVPATIAILSGVICVGLEKDDLVTLAKLGHACRKVSRRDLAAVVAEGANGATTVAGTMYVAHMAGISVFVTGGIGGVHRGVEETMDISADLTELGRTPVCVVSAGVKSILDIPKTLEYLETQGVSVNTLGSKEFPAFFTPHSGCESPHSIATPTDAAKLIVASKSLGLTSGMVVAVPIPEQFAADARVVQEAQDKALAEAKSKHVLGRDVTPFLLQRVSELTKGRSLASNIALIKNNARVGAQIAVGVSELSRSAHHHDGNHQVS